MEHRMAGKDRERTRRGREDRRLQIVVIKTYSARQGQRNPGEMSTVTLMEVGWEEGDGYEKTFIF